MPTNEIVAAVSRALLPGYMKLRHDPEKMFGAFARVWAVVALVGLPAAAGIYALAAPITLVVLGQKWAGTETLLGLIALLGAFHAMGNTLWPLVLARGGARALFLLRLFGVILTLPAFAVLLAMFGLHIAVLGLLATSLIWLIAGAVWLSGFGVREMKRLAGDLFRPVSASTAMVGVLYLSRPYFVHEGPWTTLATILMANIALGVAVCASTLSALWWASGRPAGAERDLVSIIPVPTTQ
jgi:O-antigen/teichoic acid export membrane protein